MGDRLDALARAVALVASLPLDDADRAALLERVLDTLPAGQCGNRPGRVPATAVLSLEPPPPGLARPSETPASAGTRPPSPPVPGTPAMTS